MITVLGLGFVGLTTALGFSKKGFKTYGIDIDRDRINKLKNFEIPFHEPHLKEVLHETYDETFFLDVPLEEAVKNSKAVFICVGTPEGEDGSADLSIMCSAITSILDVDCPEFKVIVTKSTVPPSTVSKRVQPYVLEKIKDTNKKIGLASNPEFLREGFCWEDFIEPDRIVIGIEDEESKKILNELYEPFGAPIHYVSYNTAEFIKYLSNTLLSTMISYANEMSMVADHIGDINIPESFKILHEDKRWSGDPAPMAKYVYPGCGYGGYCLPKDTSAIHSISNLNGYDPKILGSNLKVNNHIKDHVVSKIDNSVLNGEAIGILGLSFKPDSDDVRITPTKTIIEKLIEKGHTNIIAYDPISNEVFAEEYPDIKIEYADTLEDLLGKTETVVILTGWKEFKVKQEIINKKKVLDFRYIY